MAVRTALILIAGLLALLAGAQTATAAVAHRADGDTSEWLGEPTMLSGETRISKGELIYDDWLYDDYGADLNNAPNQPVFRSNLAPTSGDYRYPTNSTRYGYNAADLRQLRVAADGHGLHLLVFLQTMKEPDAAAVTVAIDSDRNPNAQEWPHGVGIASPSADQFITFWGTGGWVSDWRGRRAKLRGQAVNLDENAIEVDVPWRSLGRRLRGTTVKLHVVTGLADASARQYTTVPVGNPTATAPGGGQPGSTAVFDAGFDANEVSTLEVQSHWGEEVQSQALATRDISAFSKQVDLRQLERGASDGYEPTPGRFYDRIFRSDQSFDDQGELCTLGAPGCVNEGIRLKNNPSSPGGSPDAQFLSPYQPYGLYIPADYQPGASTPLLINGHSLDVNHNEYAVISPNLFVELGDDCDRTPAGMTVCSSPGQGRLVITPLARGLDTWYITSGFQDVMEAWDDVKANYGADDERTWIGGYSMGGYMTHRMGLLMPDSFAAAAAYVPPPAYQLWAFPAPPQGTPSTWVSVGQTNNIVSNGLDLPFEINNGGIDELVPPSGAQEQARTFREVWGNPHRFYFYPELDHFALIGIDQWDHTRDFLDLYLQRNLSPDEVRYRRYPATDLPQYGRRFDGAYWVDGMVTRNPASDTCSPGQSCQTQFGFVDAYTLAHGRARSTTQAVTEPYPGPPSATVQGTNRIAGAPITAQNAFEASLTNLKAITFDTAGMGIDPSAQITADLTAAEAGPFTLTLKGSFPAVGATLDGQPVSVQQVSGGIEIGLTFTAGQHDLVVTPQ